MSAGVVQFLQVIHTLRTLSPLPHPPGRLGPHKAFPHSVWPPSSEITTMRAPLPK